MRLQQIGPKTHFTRWRVLGVAILTATLLFPSISGVSVAATSAPAAADPAVITFWNSVAVSVIVTDAGKANAEAFLWYAFEQAAVYNAVVGITGRYRPYKWDPTAPDGASPQAAAAAAAYRVLLTYFPASQARLDAALAASLDQIPDGDGERRGIRFGERAAARIIKLRVDDGRFADLPFTMPPAPGVWRPTPPTFTPFFDPWLSQVTPFLLRSNTQFRPDPPPDLTSYRYAREFNEVKDLGSLTSSARTPDQTETALFFSDTGVGPLQAALRDLVTRRQMDISDSARLFAAVDLSISDAVGAIWDSKFHFGLWRPITAIQLADTDGNSGTVADTSWQPLLTTPPYPDYASGLTSVMGSASRALTHVLGTPRIDLFITSTAAGVTRHYEWAGKLNRDAIDARVWSGIHFRGWDYDRRDPARPDGAHQAGARVALVVAGLLGKLATFLTKTDGSAWTSLLHITNSAQARSLVELQPGDSLAILGRSSMRTTGARTKE